MKIFKRSVWCLLTVFFLILMLVALIGEPFALQNRDWINSFFGIKAYERVDDENSTEDTEYFKSDFYKSDKKTYSDTKMRNNSMKVATQVAGEGTVLFWNDEIEPGKKALPLKENAQVSLFGISSYDYLHHGGGSGYIDIPRTETLLTGLESEDLYANEALFDKYKALRSTYGRQTISAASGQTTFKPINENDKANYAEFSVNEVPWSALGVSGDGSNIIGKYSDSAVMIISRQGSENADTAFRAPGHIDENYMELTNDEVGVINGLIKMKNDGVIDSVILLLNTASPISFKTVNTLKNGIDACAWVGIGGSASFAQIAGVLSGEINPSGRLVNLYANDVRSAPANENFGNFIFKNMDYSKVAPVTTYTHNDRFVVYQEGIYVGYRYYETRYEDQVLSTETNRKADSSKGAYMDTKWDYAKEVAFPFGYGMSYTTFEHSGFSVEPKDDDYIVSVTIKNTGTVFGKDVLQVYLQKPYTEYDKQYGIEKSSVELAGFAKTKSLGPQQSETISVTVSGEDFKTYDAYNKKTYILEKGSYYIAAGNNSHDALNNILAKKGKTKANGMDYNGNASLVYEKTISEDNYEKYAQSSATGNEITNRFDDADINLYEGTKDQKIKYLSRKDWDDTYPSPVALSATDRILTDLNYGPVPDYTPEKELPTYGTVTHESGALTLAMLMDVSYEASIWEDLLNQLTWAEQNQLITSGSAAVGGAESVAAPGCLSQDGPCGVRTVNSTLGEQMAFPSNVILAATWNEELVEQLGEAFGLEILHSGNTGIYGTGANVHRSPYSGRNWEYFSEDGFMSGKMYAAETTGLQRRGAIVFTKHFVMNDQEFNRYGGTVWANEQAIREIYLKAFEAGITEGNANGIMSSFNRLGCVWTGAHEGLLTDILRKEWGFIGMVETDAGVGEHMMLPVNIAMGIVAGNDIWMGGGRNKDTLSEYKDNSTVAWSLRESSKRILYTQLHSSAMNGTSTTTRVRAVTGWWEITITTLKIAGIVMTTVCLLMTAASFVLPGVLKKSQISQTRVNKEAEKPQ